MKCAVILGLLCIILEDRSLASAEVALSGPSPLRKPGGCYDEDIGHLKGGQHISVPGHCSSADCGSDGTISYTGCGLIVESSQCRVSKVDLSKPHPDCCPQPICSINV